MTDYICTARTNYVRVTDPAEWERVVHATGGTPVEHVRERPGETPDREWLHGAIWDSGYGPFVDEEEFGDEVGGDLSAVLVPLLAPGEVLIYMEAGNEGNRYVAGTALAMNAVGETIGVDLYGIHELAKQLTDRPGDITMAEY